MRDSDILGKFNIDAQPLVDVRGEELKAAYQRIGELYRCLADIYVLLDEAPPNTYEEAHRIIAGLIHDAIADPLEPFPGEGGYTA